MPGCCSTASRPSVDARQSTPPFATWSPGGPASLQFVTDEVIEEGSLVVDVGRIVGPSGQSKYVVVYQRQADGSLRIIVDAASSDGPQQAPG